MSEKRDSSHHCRKRKVKGIKSLLGKFRYVLGHDIFMDRVDSLCSRALVGRLEYVHMGQKDWVEWATTHWKHVLTYISTISLLSNGWIVFVFLEAEHAAIILNSLWRIGNGSLVLGRWHAHFDPLREKVTKRHLWVLLPSLPFPL